MKPIYPRCLALIAATIFLGCAQSRVDPPACLAERLPPDATLSSDEMRELSSVVAECLPERRACDFSGLTIDIGYDETGRRIDALAYCDGRDGQVVICYPDIAEEDCAEASGVLFWDGRGIHPVAYCQPARALDLGVSVEWSGSWSLGSNMDSICATVSLPEPELVYLSARGASTTPVLVGAEPQRICLDYCTCWPGQDLGMAEVRTVDGELLDTRSLGQAGDYCCESR